MKAYHEQKLHGAPGQGNVFGVVLSQDIQNILVVFESLRDSQDPLSSFSALPFLLKAVLCLDKQLQNIDETRRWRLVIAQGESKAFLGSIKGLFC